ncbi:GntR family transcriptional regulator [Pseudarthrobacter sp. NamE5]|uniref:GntR family transcriptional regulator n=1 Tax=Pseudarthrobacter sp. NamE5 TaxID=2576839 RepID=UPI00110A38A9|nr:GntR family transcriptional regulator [Pseudarthrobacter sp. NamE5]TLM83746.1 GntR family transcriptional regulator [Pseudarthrobacter sp. NamE5]
MQEVTQLRKGAQASATQASLLDKLRKLVLSGEYPPGAPLPELFLAEEFEVSRTPVREALKQLENEGLVEIRPKVGTFVRIPTRREIVELFQLKESLEGLAAGLLAKRGPVPELEILKRNIEESERAERRADTAKYAELVHEFHWTIVQGSDNSKLVEHYGRLMNQLAYHRIVLETVERPARMRASIREHQSVLDALLEKDPVGAELAMRGHVNASSLAASRGADTGSVAGAEKEA